MCPNPAAGDVPSPVELNAIARRAAARALSSRGIGAQQTPDDAVSRGVYEGTRAHVTVRPRITADTHFGGTSEAHRGGGATEQRFSPSKPRSDRDLVGEALVQAAPAGSELVIPPGSRVTPLAKELAFQKRVTFVTGRYAEPSGFDGGAPGGGSVRRRSLRIAVASDHGGFALKAELIPLLKELGQRPADLGPPAASPSVDYPDFAERVAIEVSAGRVDMGLIVDGAGIGSAMVANKLPGVRAANCWSEATARNAREHNHANVLTLGSAHLDLGSARLIIAAFLHTEPGADRHARRAAKTRTVEERYLRPAELSRTFDEGR